MSDDDTLQQLGFNAAEKKQVVKMVEDVYSSLSFRKINYLFPLRKRQRVGKRVEFLKKEIDDKRLFNIYCFNRFVKDSNDKHFKIPIDDAILRKDKVYVRLLNLDPPLSEDDKIQVLQEKTKRSYFATLRIYNETISKIKKACETILDIVDDNIASDPAKLTTFMRFIIDTVHVAEHDSIGIMQKNIELKNAQRMKKNTELEEEEDPCDANTQFGVDWSFLGIFPKLPKDCADKKNSTKISVVGPVSVVQSGGKTRRRGSKDKSRRQTKTRHNI